MDILMPIEKPDQVPILAKAGATKFYCGLLETQWMRDYNKPAKSGTIQIAPNRREALDSNLNSLEDMKILIDEAHSFKVPIYLAVNATYFIEDNYSTLLSTIYSVADHGVDGLIIADPGLINTVTTLDLNLKIILSTLTQVANIEAVRFFRDLGVSCITFPRYMTLEEIAHITNQVPEIEYECFVMEDRCTYDDGNCNVLHCSENFFCTDEWFFYFKPKIPHFTSYEEYQKLKLHEDHYKEWTSPYANLDVNKNGWQNMGCGICAIPFLIRNTKLTCLKIAGRGAPMDQKLKALSLVSNALQWAEKGASPGEIREMVKEAQPLPELCKSRYLCYFPDVFDGASSNNLKKNLDMRK